MPSPKFSHVTTTTPDSMRSENVSESKLNRIPRLSFNNLILSQGRKKLKGRLLSRKRIM